MALRTSHVLRTSKSPLSSRVGPSVMISIALPRPPEPEMPRLIHTVVACHPL